MRSSSEEEGDESDYSDDDEELSIEMIEYDLGLEKYAEQSGNDKLSPEGREEASQPETKKVTNCKEKNSAEKQNGIE